MYMKKFLFILVIISNLDLLISCATPGWYCYVDAIGEHPSEKTYYIEGKFPQKLNPLVAKEYIKDLDVTMSHLGYSKVDSANASVKIVFGYEIGEKEERAYTNSTPILQYTPPTCTTTNSTIKTDKGTTIANISSTTSSNNKFGTVSYVGESISTSYETTQPIVLFLDAFDVKSNEPVWSVRVNDEPTPTDIQNLREKMPFYLLNMYPFIGSNTGSSKYSRIFFNDKRLLWFKSEGQK